MNEKPVKCCGQQQQWEAVPPYQTPGERSNSDFLGPLSLLWSSWIGTRCSKTDTVFQLCINSEFETVPTAQLAVISIKFLQTFTQITSFYLPFSSNETPESHSTE